MMREINLACGLTIDEVRCFVPECSHHVCFAALGFNESNAFRIQPTLSSSHGFQKLSYK